MIYCFEGARNSGKTFLSNYISGQLGTERFQFDFGQYFNLLDLKSTDNREAHSFAMGKELMLMQLGRDVKNLGDFIHDRGILTVLAWGISDNRISKDDAIEQIEFILKNDLLRNVFILYIDGDNPIKRNCVKDQWDYADNNSKEREAFEFVMSEFEKRECRSIVRFKNEFNQESLIKLYNLFNSLLRPCAVYY